MENSFFAIMSRMKLIARWSLMRSTRQESLMEHSAEVAIIGEALGFIRNEYFGGDVDVQKISSLAIYHDVNEVVSGDLPTPIKYYNEKMETAYHEIEKEITDRLLESLPDKLKDRYAGYLNPDCNSEEYKIMKAADKLSAFIKCVEERACGNHEFDKAYETIKKSLSELNMKEVDFFVDNFLEGFGKPIDVL